MLELPSDEMTFYRGLFISPTEVDDDLDVGALGEVHDRVEPDDDLELDDDLIELEPKHVFC